MTLILDRRHLILSATLGVGALALPRIAQAQASQLGFTHGVASGEPGQTHMLFWARYVPSGGGAVKIRVEVSETPDFARIAGGAEVSTGPWRDHTVKAVVMGLTPGTRYHYRFIAPDGSISMIGRTRTLPDGDVRDYGIGVFSCSNIGFGWFNAYAHAAARDDIDLTVHLGDYYYEYQKGNYPADAQAIASRVPQPLNEILTLADYRLRIASYRADPDLMALHAAKPMILQWDDHETANDSWEGGAQNHQGNEGDWAVRKAMAIQAYREWLPVSDAPWASYQIGSLATLFRTETRVLARTQEKDIAPLFKAADPARALAEFRDGAWMDPSATMMGLPQEAWLADAMTASVRGGTRWQVVGFGTIMGQTRSPASAIEWMAKDAPDYVRQYVMAGIMASKAGLPLNFDAWGGYPAARARFLKSAQAMGANLVVIAGDSHNGWAYDLAQDGKPAGVEFAGHSVTSPGYEGALAADPAVVARALVDTNPELKWCDTSRRGYMKLTLNSDSVRNDWVFMDTIRDRSPKGRVGHSATVARGRNVMA
ncbi:alkaline phosphatase D family protein [Sphingomonas sp. BGYR3]|uniref:alkaline phosphatase D family protein n=1 Tax=Sphingomonas sp. BGYR3 TaxID=2975483 RepID=UPI0021A58657|nr:alkaline phosphatase D family protein [Sphingomonas sp. BGYR3]MDG5488932.1 alkaline phosphatase D family protein [Sphingomonas sp. BGYR3]